MPEKNSPNELWIIHHGLSWQKVTFKTAIIDFYKLNSSKRKENTFKNFKNGGVHKATIYRWLEKIANTLKLPQSVTLLRKLANENGLNSLLKT